MSTTHPNLIRLAIYAAGGIDTVAKRYGISRVAVWKWTRSAGLPPEKVRDLCAAGGNAIDHDRLLDYLAETKAQIARDRVYSKAA